MLFFSSSPQALPSRLQDLPPEAAGFCLGVRRFCERDLALELRGRSLLIAFSGGADSLALLLAMRFLAHSLDLRLSVAHFDHSLRPSSEAEAAACRRFCETLDLAFAAGKADVAVLARTNKSGLEEAGRAARYAFFTGIAKEQGSDWLLTGHHLNDLAEDVLMRLLRGSGWPGLSGMAAVDDDRRLLRPLLLTPRSEIEAFLSALGLSWMQDESNEDPAYLRNRVRGEILPLFLRENPSFLRNIAGLWRLGRIDAAYFDSLIPPQISPQISPLISQDAAQSQAVVLSRKRLDALPRALRLRLYKATLAALGPGQARLSSLLALDRAWLAGRCNSLHRFSGGKTALVAKHAILWQKG